MPAYLNVVDIAGLVKGAAEGQGLGNAFLSHISACDAIFHLCRAFEDPDVTHVEGEVDPVRDLDIISDELRFKDEETLDKLLEKMERTVVRANDKKMKPEYVSSCVAPMTWSIFEINVVIYSIVGYASQSERGDFRREETHPFR